MPTITISRRILEEKLGRELSDDVLRDRIPMLGTALEGIDGDEITIEIFPNRPDMLSEQGFSRALSAFMGINPGLRKYAVKPSGHKVIIDKEMKKVRPYTSCAIVKNLKLDDEKIKELIDIQEKLHITYCRRRKKAAIGIYPFEKITTPIHFKAAKPEEIVFQPLESDKAMNAREILLEHPKGKEFAHLVDGLTKYAYFADAKGEVLSFTPIINSHLTGKVTEKTTQVFVEVSGFDMHVCNMVLNILVTAMADMGADVLSMELVYPDKTIVTPDLTPRKIEVSVDYINNKLGLNLKEKELKAILEKMGHTYKDGAVLMPAYRADIIHPIDITEDVAIAYGYENFIAEIPKTGTTGALDYFEKLVSQCSDVVASLGFLEASSFHLSNKDVQCKKMLLEFDTVELTNALTQDFNILRRTILPGLLQIYSENKHHEFPQNLFEAGTVFSKDDKIETGILERRHLAAAISSKDADFTKIKQALNYLGKMLGKEFIVKEGEYGSFIPGRAGKVFLGDKEIGVLGEVKPEVLANFGIEMPVAAMEVDLTLIS